MTVDLARLKRIRGAINAVLENSYRSQSASHGLIASFNTVRPEVQSALPDNLNEEFDRMFPQITESTQAGGPHKLIAEAKQAEAARSKLELLSGWLAEVLSGTGQ